MIANGRVAVDDFNSAFAPGYGIANVVAGLEQTRGKWRLREFARLNNLFDRQYIGAVVVGDANGRYYAQARPATFLWASRSPTRSNEASQLAKRSLVLCDSPMPAGDPSGRRKLTRRNSRRSAEQRRAWGAARGSVRDPAPPAGEDITQILYETQETPSIAAYTQADWRFMEDWTLTAGLRWTEETKDFRAGQAYLSNVERQRARNFPAEF